MYAGVGTSHLVKILSYLIRGFLIGIFALCFFPIHTAQAATFNVDSTEDLADFSPGNGKCATSLLFPKCTLRAAIMEANHLSGGPHTIVLPAGTYLLSRVFPQTGPVPEGFNALSIFASMNITTNGGIAVIRGQSGWAFRIFNIAQPATVSMTNLDIGNGHAVDGRSGGAIRIDPFSSVVTLTNVTVRDSSVQQVDGGGISSNGTLTLDRCVVTNNSAALAGGGLETFGPTLIKESTISFNSAQFGGGIANFSSLTVSRTTFQQNSSNLDGGGIYNNNSNATVTNVFLIGNTSSTRNGGGIWNEGPDAVFTVDRTTLSGNVALVNGGAIGNSGKLTMKNSTLSGNGAFGKGGAIYNLSNATINNVTIAGNSGAIGGGLMNDVNAVNSVNISTTILAGNNSSTGPDCAGNTITMQGINLIQNTTGCPLFGIAAITGQDPLLGPLQQNGGFAPTRAPGVGSPAIDHGEGALSGSLSCEPIDQRQVSRPADGDRDGVALCDIGAFEVVPVGGFDISPGDSTAQVGDVLVLQFRWTSPGSWRTLHTLQLRAVGEYGVAFTLLWDQDANTFRLFDGDGNNANPVGTPGASQHLEGKLVRLLLDQTVVQGSGPTGHDVTLTLPLIFKTGAAVFGPQTYRIEVGATDDFGNAQDFALAGTIVVQEKRP